MKKFIFFQLIAVTMVFVVSTVPSLAQTTSTVVMSSNGTATVTSTNVGSGSKDPYSKVAGEFAATIVAGENFKGTISLPSGQKAEFVVTYSEKLYRLSQDGKVVLETPTVGAIRTEVKARAYTAMTGGSLPAPPESKKKKTT